MSTPLSDIRALMMSEMHQPLAKRPGRDNLMRLRNHEPRMLKRADLLAAMIMGCWSLAHAAEAQSASPAATVIRWLPLCSDDSSTAFFTVRITKDGTVTYQGSDATKEQAEIRSEVPDEDARTLLRAAKQFAQSGTRRLRSQDDAPERTFCMEVSTGAYASARARNDSRVGKRLLAQISRTMTVEQWACPARMEPARDRPLRDAGICEKMAAIRSSLVGVNACDVGHDFRIYDDGTVHVIAREARRSDDLSERFYRVDPSAVRALVRMVQGFKQTDLSIGNYPPGTEAVAISYRDPEQILQFKAKLQELVDIQWRTSPANVAECQEKWTPESSISLRNDLDVLAPAR